MSDDEPTERRPVDPRRRALITGVAGLLAIGAVAGAGLAFSDGDQPPRPGPGLVSAWAPYWQTGTALESFETNADLFHDVTIVAYRSVDVDQVLPYENLAADAVENFRRAADDAGVPLIVSIFDEAPAGRMAAILADPETRSQHVRAVVEVVRDGGFDGVDLDYEQFAFADGRTSWAATRPNWIAFLRELDAALGDRLLMTSVPPVYDDGQTGESGYWVYDHAAMGEIVDFVRIMAYDYSTSEPGPIAPIEWVRQLSDATAALIPGEKVLLGVPAYGHDWPTGTTGTCPADAEPRRRSVTTSSAPVVAAERGATITHDPVTAEAGFSYTETLTGVDASGNATSCTVDRTVRFMDPTGIGVRAELARDLGFGGVAIWALGNEDDLSWAALRRIAPPPTTTPPAT